MTETISIDQIAKETDKIIEDIDDNQVKGVSNLCNTLSDTLSKIDQCKKLKDDLQKQADKLAQELIPQAMQETGLKTLVLDNGDKVEVKPLLRVSPLVENRPFVYQWLRDNGFGDLVKNEISASFGRNEDDMANNFKEEVKKLGLLPKQTEKVEPSTLRAFVNEQVVVNGRNDLPLDKFGAYIGQQAKITKG